RATGVLAVMVTKNADFIVSAAPCLQRTVKAGRERGIQRLRRGYPFLERTEIRTVRITIGHLRGVHELLKARPVPDVQLVVQVHPLVDHERLPISETLTDFRTLLCRKFEIFNG